MTTPPSHHGPPAVRRCILASANTVVLGFSRAESAELGYYHNVVGVGKARTIRRFFGLTEKEQRELGEMARGSVVVKT